MMKMDSEVSEAEIEPDLIVPEFRPTEIEFEDFHTCVSKLCKFSESVGLFKVGSFRLNHSVAFICHLRGNFIFYRFYMHFKLN